MDQPITKEIMLKICNYGTYFNPANKHYKTTASVVCDRCFTNNLTSCIGWQTFDLCLTCVDTINKKIIPSILSDPRKYQMLHTTNMKQNQFENGPLTEMKQNQFNNDRIAQMRQFQFKGNDDDTIKTYMMQSQFRTINRDD